MEERIKDLFKKYEEQLNYHSGICDDYIKKYGYDKCDYIIHHTNMRSYFLGSIQALNQLLS